MKDYSTILEAIEQKIEYLEPGQAVNLDEITGGSKEKEIIAGTKMLLKKYGITYLEDSPYYPSGGCRREA